MNFRDVELTSFIPLLVALVSAVPLILAARNHSRAEVPKGQAEAIQALVVAVDTLLGPLNARIKEMTADQARARSIDRIQQEIIRTSAECISHVTVGLNVLSLQLEREGITPNFIVNGDVAAYRKRINDLTASLYALEESCDQD